QPGLGAGRAGGRAGAGARVPGGGTEPDDQHQASARALGGVEGGARDQGRRVQLEQGDGRARCAQQRGRQGGAREDPRAAAADGGGQRRGAEPEPDWQRRRGGGRVRRGGGATDLGQAAGRSQQRGMGGGRHDLARHGRALGVLCQAQDGGAGACSGACARALVPAGPGRLCDAAAVGQQRRQHRAGDARQGPCVDQRRAPGIRPAVALRRHSAGRGAAAQRRPLQAGAELELARDARARIYAHGDAACGHLGANQREQRGPSANQTKQRGPGAQASKERL
ncbi:hypothetical protein IWW47_006118, partial [Coemansia sp. RSA 2052]